VRREHANLVRVGVLWTLSMGCLPVIGCSGSAPPAPQAPPVVAKATPAPAPPTEPGQAAPTSAQTTPPLAEPPAADAYTYNPGGRRDPFRSIIVTGEKKNVEFLPPLQRHEVSELKFVAVVWGGLGTYGMLELPDGKGYVVRIGTRVGPNQGVVRRITAKDLTVVERYVDFFGEARTREIVLELRTRSEEGLE